MRHLALFVLSISFLSGAALAQTSQEDQARIQLLEDQVLELKTELRRLKLVLSELRTDMSKMNRAVANTPGDNDAESSSPASECLSRIENMRVRRDQLLSLGFKETHPDAVNLQNSINALQERCDAGGR